MVFDPTDLEVTSYSLSAYSFLPLGLHESNLCLPELTGFILEIKMLAPKIEGIGMEWEGDTQYPRLVWADPWDEQAYSQMGGLSD